MPNRKGHTKVKVRHVEGELTGLEEFVHATHLRCRWKDWSKVERDEREELAFYERMEDEDGIEGVIAKAVSDVLVSSGEDLWVYDHTTYSRVYAHSVAGLERVADRAGVTDRPWRGRPCFKNRDGDIYMPNRMLLDVALAFAQAEPETVNLYLDTEEQELLQEGYATGKRYLHKWALEKKPAWALARSWTIKEGARDHLLEEMERLRSLLRQAVSELRDAGKDRVAARLERALAGK